MNSTELSSVLIDAAPLAFSLLNDSLVKLLPSPICHACWNPTMDLLAIASEDQRLSLHRLDLQRVWSITSSALITAICWRPDGKALVAGHQDGSIVHFNVERGEIVLRMSPVRPGQSSSKAICQLLWVHKSREGKEVSETSHLGRRHSSLLPRPPSQPPKPPAVIEDLSSLNSTSERVWPSDHMSYNILVAQDKEGLVRLLENGRLEMASVKMIDGVNDAASSLVVSISKDLKALVATLMPKERSSSSSSAEAIILSLDAIEPQAIHDLSILMSDAEDSLKGIELGLTTCLKEWSSVQKELQSKMVDSLAQILRDNSSSSMMVEGEESEWQEDDELVEGELICLLATGCASAGMRAFLASTLGETNLKRLAKTLDSALESIHSILLDMVKPSLESVAFILEEVREMSLSQAKVGLSLDVLLEAEFQAAMAILQCEALRVFVESFQHSLRVFFNWLLRVWHQQEGGSQAAYTSEAIETPDIKHVLSLLTRHLLTDDMILPDLQESNLPSPRAASLESLLSETKKDTRALIEIMFTNSSDSWPRVPLRQQIRNLSFHFGKMTSVISTSLTSQVKCIRQVPIGGPDALTCSHSGDGAASPSSIHVCVVLERRIIVLALGLEAVSQLMEIQIDPLRFLSASFYRNSLLLALSFEPVCTLVYLPLDTCDSIKARSFNTPLGSREVVMAISEKRGTGLIAFNSYGAEKEEASVWLLDLQEDEDQ